MMSHDGLVSSLCRQSFQLFYETRFVIITNKGLAIWLDPFGMLNAQVVVNLLPELAVGTDLGRHGDDSNAARDRSRKVLFRIVGGRSSRDGTECPSERVAKCRTEMLAVCTTLGALGYFTTLVFQQYGEQSTLRKGQRRFCHETLDKRTKTIRMRPWSQRLWS
jgi:hypothetical protein